MPRKAELPAPYWSLDGLALGARMSLPLVPAIVVFGIAVGVAAAGKGLTLVESLLMSGIVFAGMSQMVTLEVWPAEMTLGAIAGLTLLAATVNARMLLLGAGLRPWFGLLPAWQVYPALFMLTDASWLIALRYRADGGSDAGVFLGSCLLTFPLWVAVTGAGYLAGALVPDPRAAALDMVMPVFFAAMLVPLWRGPRRGVPWLVAGAVALAIYVLAGGWWYVIAGALAGIVTAGFIDDE